MVKPFLTIEQQTTLLESRGMKTSPDTGEKLLREGYYSIINGYKAPFIDEAATKAAGDDRYTAETSFESLYNLFSFDRSLRSLTFRYLIKAEATARTAIAYCFSEAHRGPDDYLLQANFCSKKEFVDYGKNESEYADELSRLTGILGRRARNSSVDFIDHYRQDYGSVPLWVLVNDLTFGNLEHFFNLMKPSEKAAVCKCVSKSTGRLGSKSLGFFEVDKARVYLEVLVKFRNICAHDERLYCARVGGRKNVNYAKMVWMLERFLTEDEFYRFHKELIDLLNESAKRKEAINHVLDGLGFMELATEIKRRVAESSSTEE